MKKYIGIDIGGTAVKAAIVGEDGKILKRSSIPTLATRPYAQIVADIGKQVNELMKGETVEAIGIGCPGAIDSVHGIIRYNNNLYWKNVPLVEELHKYVKHEIRISNDANVAALGEARFGAGKSYTDSALITLGTGVGGGIVVGGKLFEGYAGMGAEIGHIVIRSNGVQCTCGRKGCWEAYSSATGLIRETTVAMLINRTSLMWEFVGGDLNKVDGRTAFECAKKGDAPAQRVVDTYIGFLAEGIVNIINVFRSQVIILGGGVCAQGEYLLNPLQAKVNELRYGGEESLLTELKIASLGNDAGVVGAASLVM